MLADECDGRVSAGALSSNVLLPGEWLSSLVAFISGALPDWRDDPYRPAASGETSLTAQLCAYLNGLSRRTAGWDFLQFRREEPDDTDARRSIDLIAAPSGTVIWLAGREYSEYRSLLQIECKRLPTPSGSDRDEREYLYSRFSTTGGVQRFKAGNHGAAHARAAMIAYVQESDIPMWKGQIDQWVQGLHSEAIKGWTLEDLFHFVQHDETRRVASLHSSHSRLKNLPPITLDHLWIEMKNMGDGSGG